MVHNIPKSLRDAEIEKALKGNNVTIIASAQPTSRKNKALYTAYMKTLAKKANQDLYTKFTLEKGIDFIPAYVMYEPSSKTMKMQVRNDFLKKKLKAELNFVEWLRSKKSAGLVKHRIRHAKEYEHYLMNESSYAQKPHWIKKAKKIWAKDYFSRDVNKDKKKNDGIGTNIMRSDYHYEEIDTINGKGEISRRKYAFTNPIQNDSLKKALDPDNEDELFGDKKTLSYIKKYDVNQKLYQKIMKEVLTKLWKAFENIDSRVLTEESVDEYQKSFSPNFPNITRIRDWFINKGINNTEPFHHFTLEKFMSLKSNTARSNFIDRAVFVIANSMYMKGNNIKSTFASGKQIQSAGARIPLSKARKYKKLSKTRTKYQTTRTTAYSEWKLDNRKLSANLKRQTTRKDNRSKRQT